MPLDIAWKFSSTFKQCQVASSCIKDFQSKNEFSWCWFYWCIRCSQCVQSLLLKTSRGMLKRIGNLNPQECCIWSRRQIDQFFSLQIFLWTRTRINKCETCLVRNHINNCRHMKKGATRIRTWVNRNSVTRGFKTCHLNRWIIAPIICITTNSLLLTARQCSSLESTTLLFALPMLEQSSGRV